MFLANFGKLTHIIIIISVKCLFCGKKYFSSRCFIFLFSNEKINRLQFLAIKKNALDNSWPYLFPYLVPQWPRAFPVLSLQNEEGSKPCMCVLSRQTRQRESHIFWMQSLGDQKDGARSRNRRNHAWQHCGKNASKRGNMECRDKVRGRCSANQKVIDDTLTRSRV